MDGGVVASKPLIIAYRCARELKFLPPNHNNMKMLSIGTMSICELDIKQEDVEDAGIVTWMGLGLAGMVCGEADDTDILHMAELLGPYNFKRVHCDCRHIAMDDMSTAADTALKDAVTTNWDMHGDQLLQFISRT